MLIVRLYVNQTHIGTVSARRIKGNTDPDSVNTYLINEGDKTVKHRYGDGAAKLAQKMLKHIQEERRHG